MSTRRALVWILFVAGCAGGAASPTASPAGTASAPASAPAPSASSAERAFAGSPLEATQLIGAVLEQRSVEMNKCIAEYRKRKNLPHERVEVSVGIDQNGKLIGATLKKGKTDQALTECMQNALANAPFPRSHAGIITTTKSYEDIVQ